MDFPTVQQYLNDLPNTFKRPGAPYTQLIDSISAALARFTTGSDGVMAQTIFGSAQYGWLDIWGLIANVVRRPNEADAVYQARILNTLIAPHTTPVALFVWLQFIEGVTAIIVENLPSVGYAITLPPTLLLAQLEQIVLNLAYVRPAGMPFVAQQQTGGTFLNTVDYTDLARATGEFLGGASTNLGIVLPASTNNATPLLPSLLMTDPTLNPSLA